MFQSSLLPQEHNPVSPSSQNIDLSGYKAFYTLLRALVSVQDENTFFERLRILLLLSQWSGDPPSVHILARILGTTQDGITPNLSVLRSAGWLTTEDDRRYLISARGRILIVLLQLLAQPWQEGDVAMIAGQLYQTAEGLGLRRDLLRAQFDTVLSTIDERTRLFETILDIEDTQQVSDALKESHRDVKVAHTALELRQKGATLPEEYDQVQRMHRSISRMMQLTSDLDLRYQNLIARDLLARGLVSLGDILTWAREASEHELADSIQPFLLPGIMPLWATPERLLLDRGIELSGKVIERPKMNIPVPVPVAQLPVQTDMDEIKQAIFYKQLELRDRLMQTDPLMLAEWVDQMDWQNCVLHFLSAIDPELQKEDHPVYLLLDPDGKLNNQMNHAADAVTQGQLSRKERSL